MSSRKEYEMLFKLNAQLGGSYNSTFKAAQKELSSMQKEIQDFSKTQSDISSFQKQQGAIEATDKKLAILRQQYDNIQKEMDETGSSSSTLQNKLLSKQLQIDKTSSSLDRQKASLNQMDAALREAGVDTAKLGNESTRLGTQIDALKQKQEDAASEANNFGSSASQAFGVVQEAIAAAGVAVALKEIYEAFWACADASIAFESAMTGVAKTTNFTNEEFAAMSDEIKAMSTEIPATTEELALIAETAGQLGIQKNSLLDFTEIMAMLGTATNMTADEAATMLAQFASITGMSPAQYSNLGSTIVDLGNNFATTERNIAAMSQTIAAAGAISGMSEADITAIAAAVTSLGISTENGGTQMTKLISDINSAVSSGEGLSGWASAAQMSATDFAAAWGEDAAGALDLFIHGLNETYESGGDVYGVLSDLGITETRMVTAITSMAKSGTRLTETLDVANRAWDENNALMTEAEKRYATTASQQAMAESAYNNLAVAVGDNYTPALQKFYAVETEVFKGLTAFVEANPALIKAATAFVAVLGTATVALTVYAAVKKVVDALNLIPIFTAAQPIMLGVTAVAALVAGLVALSSVTRTELDASWELTAASREQYNQLQELNTEYERTCEAYGETSYEAQSLQWQITELNSEYENSKETLAEYEAASDELISSYRNMANAHQQTQERLSTEDGSVDALISKLAELTSTTDGATNNQQAILAIIDALNTAVPELALSYDSVINGADGFIDSLHDIAAAQAAQKKMDAQWGEYVERVGEQDALRKARETAEYNAKIAQEEYDIAKKAYDAATAGNGLYLGSPDQARETAAAKEQLDVYNATLADSTAVYDENEQAVKDLELALRAYDETQDGTATSANDLQGAIASVTKEMAALNDAYQEAYAAAYNSISGQYALWDEAAGVVATSASSINSALESQVSYWQEYNSNLQTLTDRSADIAGLSDVIASFADGSTDSVNAIAGMASASDDDLAAMVANWKALQEEQTTTADSMAALVTDFTNSMDSLQLELEAAIGEMDLGAEAAESGKNTMQGFINGAGDMLPLVEAAYARIAQAAMDAIDAQLQIHSPSRVMMEKAEMTWAGYIKQTEAMTPDVKYAMASAAGAGTEAFSAEEAQMVSIAPQLMAYLNAFQKNNAISAEQGASDVNWSPASALPDIHIHFDISGNVTDATMESLRQYGNEFAEAVLEVIENREIDRARRAYT